MHARPIFVQSLSGTISHARQQILVLLNCNRWIVWSNPTVRYVVLKKQLGTSSKSSKIFQSTEITTPIKYTKQMMIATLDMMSQGRSFQRDYLYCGWYIKHAYEVQVCLQVIDFNFKWKSKGERSIGKPSPRCLGAQNRRAVTSSQDARPPLLRRGPTCWKGAGVRG